MTPYDRLVALLATNDCEHCGRYDVPEPTEAALALGVSETTLRRLMSKDASPPRWSSIEVMAARLNERQPNVDAEPWTPVRLVSTVWPSLDSARGSVTATKPVPGPEEDEDRG